MIRCFETYNGRKTATGSQPMAEIEWLVCRGAGDADAAGDADLQEALREQSPSFYVIAGYALKRTAVSIDERIAPNIWKGIVKYGSEDSSSGKDGNSSEVFSYTFETTGGTQRIFQSFKTTAKAAVPGANAPDFGGAIGCGADGVEGVEITVPQFAFGGTYYFAGETVTDDFKRILFKLTGKINKSDFDICGPGEALFLGAQGSRRGLGDWEISFKFAGSASVVLPAMGQIPAGTKKRGWDYVWVRYERRIIGAGADKTPAMVPKYLYVEQVYEEADFGALGIGG